MRKLALVGESRPTCDARALGANCDACPLKGQRPVPPETRPGAKLVALGESPGENEVEKGRPFVGASGYRLHKALAKIGWKREDLHVTNTILCRPKPKMSAEDWAAAKACCAPRLEAELDAAKTAGAKAILAMGDKALGAVVPGKSGITVWFGEPFETRWGTVIGSFHPAFCLRSPGYFPVFQTMVARAAKAALGQLKWDWGRLVWEPQGPTEVTIAALKELSHAPFLSVDIENRPSDGAIRCIGVGTSDLAVSVLCPPEGIHNPSCFSLVVTLLGGTAVKVMQNGRHDRRELKKEMGIHVAPPYFDTLLAHAVVAPRLKHDLGFMAAVEFPAERWKSKFKNAKEEKGRKKKVAATFEHAPPELLLPYNCKDVVGQARLQPVLQGRLDTVHRGQELFAEYQTLNEIAIRMQDAGIAVDEEARQAHRQPLVDKLLVLKKKFREIVTDENVKLGANGLHASLGRFFFGKLKITPVAYSEKTGGPSLSATALTRYQGDFQTKNPLVSELCRVILNYREHYKLLSSYIDNLPVEGGKVFPQWNIFGARTGRWSCQDPALQTIPAELRDIFCVPDGQWMAEADWSQLEVRLMALLSGDDKLLTWYENGKDIYTEMAKGVFGTQDVSKQQRQLTKKVVLGRNYGGGADTIWRQYLADYPTLKMAAVEYALKKLDKEHPKIEAFAQEQLKQAQTLGYVEEVFSGRRQYYHDGNPVPTEVRNYPIQGAAGFHANLAVKAVDRMITWGPEALLAQVHDALIVQGPNKDRLIDMLRSAMEITVKYQGRSIFLPVEVKVGRSWGKLEKVAH